MFVIRSVCLGLLVLQTLVVGELKAHASTLTFPQYKIVLSSSSEGPVLALNKHTTMTVTLVPLEEKAPGVEGIKFDARMPQHKHGMVTTAKVTKVNDLEYKIEGVRLHMPGLWIFDFVIAHKNTETKISVPFDLPPI